MSTTVTPPPKKVNHIAWKYCSTKGSKTTLCAGCGHNSISERVIESFYDLGVNPYTVAKFFRGIGCSSKSPAYFLGLSHGFNAVHGRMPAIAHGRAAREPDDAGDRRHRRRRHRLHRHRPVHAPDPPQYADDYVIEDNGVYGLTKGHSPPRRTGLYSEIGTSQQLTRSMLRRAGHEMGRHLCGPVLQWRQEAAHRNPQDCDCSSRPFRHRRGFPLCDLQRS